MTENFTEGNCVFRELINYVTSQCFTLLMYVSMISVGGGGQPTFCPHCEAESRQEAESKTGARGGLSAPNAPYIRNYYYRLT